MKRFKNKVVVITGGNSGIGYATAKRFVSGGANVIITGRNKESVKKAASELNATGIVADQGNVKDIEYLVDLTGSQFGGVDVLFINAGVAFVSSIEDTTEEVFDRIMNINFKGAYFTLSRFIPFLNEHAAVTFLSSVGAGLGEPGGSVYGASKAAVNSLVKTASIELAAKNIRVNAVSPGPVNTPIFSKAGVEESHKVSLNYRVPLSRMGKPDEIAKLVTFLSSREASFITGSDYIIDGGTSINTISGGSS